MRAGGGSALRAWFVAHEGASLSVAITVVTCLGAGYGWSTVPSIRGGSLPVWLLAPPLLALFAGLSAANSMPALLWARGATLARLGWACTVCALAGAGGGVVGASAAQADLGRSTVVLTCWVFGGSVLLGRAAPLVAAVPLVVMLVQVHAVRDVSPHRIWSALSPGEEAMVGAACLTALLAYGLRGTRSGVGSLGRKALRAPRE